MNENKTNKNEMTKNRATEAVTIEENSAIAVQNLPDIAGVTELTVPPNANEVLPLNFEKALEAFTEAEKKRYLL